MAQSYFCQICGCRHVPQLNQTRLGNDGVAYQYALPPCGVACANNWFPIEETSAPDFPAQELLRCALRGGFPFGSSDAPLHPRAIAPGVWFLGQICPYCRIDQRREILFVVVQDDGAMRGIIAAIRGLRVAVACVWVLGDSAQVNELARATGISAHCVGLPVACHRNNHPCENNLPTEAPALDNQSIDSLRDARQQLLARFEGLSEYEATLVTAYAFDRLPNGRHIPVEKLMPRRSKSSILRDLERIKAKDRYRSARKSTMDAIHELRAADRRGKV